MNIQIRKLEASDWESVKEIYRQGIETKNATFETVTPSWENWNKNHLPYCRIAAELNSEVIGWAVLSAFSPREVYRGVAEVSIYISLAHSGKGIGKKLLSKLVEDSEAKGIWSLQASIFTENTASIQLHKSCGFRVIGFLEKISKMDEKWRDTVLLERRSKVTGV